MIKMKIKNMVVNSFMKGVIIWAFIMVVIFAGIATIYILTLENVLFPIYGILTAVPIALMLTVVVMIVQYVFKNTSEFFHMEIDLY